MIKILRIPREISPFFQGLKGRLTETQFKHLRALVLAFAISWERKNVATLKKILPGEVHHTNLSLFYRYGWNEADALDFVAREKLGQLGLARGDTLYLILDDTKVRKRGKAMKGLHKIKDPATGRYFFGHTFLTSVLYARGAVIPWRIMPWFDKRFCRKAKRPYRTLQAMAVECVEAAASLVAPDVRVVVLFDAYYACDAVFDACERMDFLFVTTLPSNRNLSVRGRTKKAGVFAPRHLAQKGAAARLGPEHARPFRKFRAVALDAVLKSGRPLHLVFSRRKNDRKVLVLATNDFQASASRVIERYLHRWTIEVFFKDAKQLLGLAHYQCLDPGAISRHVHLSALAYALLTHPRLAAGEKGKRHDNLVSRDTTRTRQAELRNLVLRDNFKILQGGARRNKSLERVINLLLAA